MSYRIDKFIWSVRLCKTRSQATDLIAKGKVQLNGTSVKPSKEVKVGDEIVVNRNAAVFTYKILQLLSSRVGPKLVDQYLIDTTPEIEREKFRLYRDNQLAYQQFGDGKPNKKQRRDLDDFLESW
jgi:ribosome-associated heat shock protein Hsp15